MQEDSISTCEIVYDTLVHKNVYKIVDELPQVEGGMSSLFELIGKKVSFSTTTINHEDSKVMVGFIVDKSGQIYGERIIRNIKNSTAGEQILEILKQVKWVSGKCKGKDVDTFMVLPVYIHLG